MDEKKPIKKLSKGVLDLKFMKKSKENAKIREENEERELLYEDQLSSLQNSGERVVLIGSHYDIMSYLPCRLSFGGMEPSIEKLNADKLKGLYEPPKQEKEEEPEEDVDVTSKEMTSHFTSMNKTLADKFNKNQRAIHKEFLAPHKRKKRDKYAPKEINSSFESSQNGSKFKRESESSVYKSNKKRKGKES